MRAEATRRERKEQREALPPPRGGRPTLAELAARYPHLAIGTVREGHGKGPDAHPFVGPISNYSDKPCSLSEGALRALGIEPKVDSP
jgi:hypothetical protein